MPTKNNRHFLQTFGTTSNTSSVNNDTIPTSTCLSCPNTYPNPTNSCIPPPIYPPGQPTPTSNQFYSIADKMYAAWYSYQLSTTVANGNTNFTTLPTTPVTTPIGPKNIYIIRHGEKGQCSSLYKIDYNGVSRASNLVNYFNNFSKKIDYIVTCNPCPYNTSDAFMRPSQTIALTSFMLDIPTFVYGGAQDFGPISEALFENSTSNPYNGMNVLICWEHSAIQPLMLNLLNKAGEINRLPASVVDPTNNLTGSNFFKELATGTAVTSSSSEYAISDGYYLSTSSKGESSTPYNVDTNTLPNYIYGTDSKYLPYWNNSTFNLTYHIGTASGSTNANELNLFDIYTQPINTCFASNTIKIGLYQPLTTRCTSSNEYYTQTGSSAIENGSEPGLGEVPIAWAEP